MADSMEKLRLKGQAEEDIYFAKRDRELIAVLRQKKLRGTLEDPTKKEHKLAKKYEKRYAKINDRHKDKPKKLRKSLRKLIAKVRKRLSRVLAKRQ